PGVPSPIASALIGIGGPRGRNAEFLLQLSFDGNDRCGINAERQLEVQSRWNVLEVLAEALHDSDGIARHRVIGRPREQAGPSENGNDNQPARPAARQELLEPSLPLSYEGL